MFGEDQPPPQYSVATWQYGSCIRVTSPGSTWDTVEEAKHEAERWTQVNPKAFTDGSRDSDQYAQRAYKDKLDLVVIYRAGRDEIVSWAPLGGSWEPFGG